MRRLAAVFCTLATRSWLVLVVALAACQADRGNYVEITVPAKGKSKLDTAGAVVQDYYGNARFVGVVDPSLHNPTEKQLAAALSMAVVQPEVGGVNAVRLRCTVHEPDPVRAAEIGRRCVDAMLDSVKRVGGIAQ